MRFLTTILGAEKTRLPSFVWNLVAVCLYNKPCTQCANHDCTTTILLRLMIRADAKPAALLIVASHNSKYQQLKIHLTVSKKVCSSKNTLKVKQKYFILKKVDTARSLHTGKV